MSEAFPDTPESNELRQKIFDLMPNPKTAMGFHFTNAIMDALITDLIVLCDGDVEKVKEGLDAFHESATVKLSEIGSEMISLFRPN